MTRILGTNPITNALSDEQELFPHENPMPQGNPLDKPTFGEKFGAALNKFGSFQGKLSQENTPSHNCRDSKMESGKPEKTRERNLQGKLQQIYLQKSFDKKG